MAKIRQYEMDMTSGSIARKMLRFALPLMASSILQLLFNAADIVVVGRFAGDNSLAAVGSTSSLINLLTNLFVGLSIGANVLAARFYGAHRERELHDCVHTAMLLSLLSGLLLTVVGMVGARQILIWMRTPEVVLDLATQYLRIYFLGMTSMMFYNFGAALLRAVGDTRRPLYYLLLAGVVNVVLNLFFVIVCKLDVAGVAIATAISQTISALLILRCMLRDGGAMHLELKGLRIDAQQFRSILRIGLPAGLQGIVFGLSNVVIQSSINGFGAVVVAGNSAASNIEGFVYVAMNAFYQATISFTSQNLGAGKLDRVDRTVLTGEAMVLVVGLALGTLAVVFGRQLLGIYSGSDAVIDAGLYRLRVIARTYAICGMMDVMVGALRGVGYSIAPMLVSIVGVCGLRLVWLATVFQLPQWHTTTVVYLSYPVSWVVTAAVHVACFLWARRKLRAHLAVTV